MPIKKIFSGARDLIFLNFRTRRMEFETLLNSISELENQNRIEERKLSEEERRHQATKVCTLNIDIECNVSG